MKLADTRFDDAVLITTRDQKKVDIFHQTIEPGQLCCQTEYASFYFSVDSVERICDADSLSDMEMFHDITESQEYVTNRDCMICEKKESETDERLAELEYTDTQFQISTHESCLFKTARQIKTVLDDRSEEIFAHMV